MSGTPMPPSNARCGCKWGGSVPGLPQVSAPACQAGREAVGFCAAGALRVHASEGRGCWNSPPWLGSGVSLREPASALASPHPASGTWEVFPSDAQLVRSPCTRATGAPSSWRAKFWRVSRRLTASAPWSERHADRASLFAKAFSRPFLAWKAMLGEKPCFSQKPIQPPDAPPPSAHTSPGIRIAIAGASAVPELCGWRGRRRRRGDG